MTILNILHYPDEKLHKIARPVEDFGPDLQQLIEDMAETMYAAPGIGLAATQVDVHLRLLVMDLSEEKNELIVMANPHITHMDGEVRGEEGCLSVPGIYDKVERAERVNVRYMDLDGKTQTLQADGLLAVCIQHEMDHLNGKVFVDHLSQLKQTRIRNKLAKQARVTA